MLQTNKVNISHKKNFSAAMHTPVLKSNVETRQYIGASVPWQAHLSP